MIIWLERGKEVWPINFNTKIYKKFTRRGHGKMRIVTIVDHKFIHTKLFANKYSIDYRV